MQFMFSLVLFAFFEYPCHSQTQFPDAIINSYDQYMTQVLACQHIPVASIAAVKLQESDTEEPYVFSKIYQNSEYSTTTYIDETTPFCIGEVTQTLVTLLYAKMVENGTVDFDSTLSDLLAQDPAVGPFGDLKTNEFVKARQILSHSTGISSYDSVVKTFGTTFNDQQYLQAIGKLHENVNNFEAKREKNDFLFGIIGSVISKILKKDWREALKTEILNKIGIQNAIFVDNITDFSYILPAEIYTDDWYSLRQTVDNYHSIKPFGASGSVCLSNNDMIAFMSFLLKTWNGMGDSSVIQPETLETLFSPEIPLESPRVVQEQLQVTDGTMGWLRGIYKDHDFVYVQGEYLGYSSAVIALPTLKLGVFITLSGSTVLTSGSNLELYMLEYFLSYMLPQPSYPLFTQYEACALNPLQLATEDADCSCPFAEYDDVDKYIGSYTHGTVGEMIVKREDSVLKTAFGKTGIATLCPWPDAPGAFWLYFDDLFWNQQFKLCPTACLRPDCEPSLAFLVYPNASKVLTFRFANEVSPPVFLETKSIPTTTVRPQPRSGNAAISLRVTISVFAFILFCAILPT